MITRDMAGEYWPELILLARECGHPSMMIHNDRFTALVTIADDLVDRAVEWHERTAIELFGEFRATEKHLRDELALRIAIRDARK